jgi:hypothetical protein
MTELSGSFAGRTRLLHVVSLSGVLGHELQTIEVAGAQNSTDEK